MAKYFKTRSMRKSVNTRLALVLPFDPLRQRPLVVNEHMKISGNPEEPFKHDRIRKMVHCHGAIGDLEFPLAFEEHKKKLKAALKKQEEETCPELFPPKPYEELFMLFAKEVFVRRTTRNLADHRSEFDLFVSLLRKRYKSAKGFPKVPSTMKRKQKKKEVNQGQLFDTITDANKKTPYSM